MYLQYLTAMDNYSPIFTNIYPQGARGSSGSSLTFSGLLNTLDGVASSEVNRTDEGLSETSDSSVNRHSS